MENQLEMPKPEHKKTPKFARKHLIVACAVLLVAAALALNLTLFGKTDVAPTDAPSNEPTDDTATNEAGSYFSATQVSRQRARDEALEVLQGVVENENADEATKTGALLEISKLAKEMEAEANIESLVLSRGFAQCVAIINDDTCSIVVSAEALEPNQISQINEIVFEQAGIKPANIKIIAKQ